MDGERFDRFAQGLVEDLGRRRLLGGLAGVATLLGLGVASEAGAKKKRDTDNDSDKDKNRKVKAEGPCGNGSAKKNRCQKDKQCCTGYCKKGRCRCRKEGQTCTEDRNCCPDKTGRTCIEGTCQLDGVCIPLGGACADGGDPCCTDVGSDASCDAGICRAPAYCTTTLEGAGCEFLAGPGVWNCGNLDLTGVDLSGCVLTNASFFNTNASNVTFVSTNLTGANFFDANVTGAEWDNTTCPGGTNSDDNGDTCCGAFISGQVPTGCAAG